ncbi:MAG TPA: putative quinol monooxygenase [Pirellulales bacterium]|jgi:quinol monooxygenase YgiN
MIYVVAVIEIAPGQRDAFLALQKELLPLVRAEAGCIEYLPTVDVAFDPKRPPRADCVVMQEKWESLPHLKAHSVAPHMKAFREKAGHLMHGVKIEVFEAV